MKKIISYIAISLNGKIAREDGSVDWLESIPNPTQNDYGYYAFYDSVDTTIQGYGTYRQLLDWNIPFPYKETKNYVLTHRDEMDTEDVIFIDLEYVATLKKGEGKDIWLIGGGITNTALLNRGLIDELKIYVMPIIIPDGLDLFANMPEETMLELINSQHFDTGVVELHYKVIL